MFTFFARFAPARTPRERLERLLRRGRYAEALSTALEMHAQAASDDERAYALNKRGIALLRLGRRGDARAAFDAALDVDTRNAAALTNIGNMLLEEGNAAAALAQYEAAIAADIDYPNAYFNKSIALKRLGRVSEAVRTRKEGARLEGRLRWKQRKRL